MHDGAGILLDLFLVFLLARIGGEILVRLKQPSVIGELLVGIVIGPHALGLVQEGEVLRSIAEVGVVFLLFEAGLENRFSDLRKVGRTAGAVAVSGVIVPFVLGVLLLLALGHAANESAFMGAALVATSVGVTARVFGDLRMLREAQAQVVLAAAVIDDVLGLLVLAVVTGLAAGGLELGQFALLLGEAAFFLVFVTLVGSRLMRRHGPLFDRIRVSDGPFVVAVTVCLGLSALATQIGLAAIVGAFLAGMVFAETREHFAMERRIEPVTHFLTPFFFVLTGMAVDPRFLVDPAIVGLGTAVLALAMLSKFAPCSLAARKLGRSRAIMVGIGMIPRAEVGIIVASIGLREGVLGEDLYGVVVLMSVLTTLVTPPLLRVVAARGREPEVAPELAGRGVTEP